LKTSRDAWNHGKTAGIAVSMPKGTTSKETVETRGYNKQFFLWALNTLLCILNYFILFFTGPDICLPVSASSKSK
jgi:hypothetical protein